MENKILYRVFSTSFMQWLLGKEECANWRLYFSTKSKVYTDYYEEL